MQDEFHNFAYISASLVHSIQRERGFVAAYLKSQGVIFKERLQQHFSHTDEIFKHYEEHENSPADFPQAEAVRVSMRQQIMDLAIADHVALDFYTYKLINPLLQDMVRRVVEYLPDCDKTHSVYNAFLQWKENLGLERALGTRALIDNTNPQEFTARLNLLMQKEESNKQICLLLADERQKALFANLHNASHGLLEDIQARIKCGDSLSSFTDYDLTPEKWFHLTDEKMDRLHGCEKQLIDIICEQRHGKDSRTEAIESPEHLKDYWGFLKTLPLFKDIDDGTLGDILGDAALLTCKKGEVLFEQQELPVRFYVILDGWVKVGSLSAEGEEVVLQTLSSGESIMEHAVLLNMPCPAAAIAVKQTRVLAIEAAKMRDHINHHHTLALNLLHAMASRSQSFIWHVENMRSHNAEHRLGWFLLRELLDNNSPNPPHHQVHLPYDKAIIASYLNMKPETLSRAFKKLKTQGFVIKGDTITIPDFATLCEFCNQATAMQCTAKQVPNFCHQT